jgi:ATP-dependent DNA helicase RecG
LIHRDYSRLGAVHVQWHEDWIEISNPGGFPEGVRLDNLLVTPPRPRNPSLADAFKRAGIVERTARVIEGKQTGILCGWWWRRTRQVGPSGWMICFF